MSLKLSREEWELADGASGFPLRSEMQSEITRLTARIAELEKALAAEERSHEQTVADRDAAEEAADQLVERIEALLCVDCGEHSNLNNPWKEACDFLDGALSASQDKGGES